LCKNVGCERGGGHGRMGVAAGLAHSERLRPGTHRFETPVGVVTVTLEDANHVAIDNVASYRHAKDVAVDVPELGKVQGDVAWGGNWFYLVEDHGERLLLDNVERLTDVAWSVRNALTAANITGANGAEIDHIELCGAPCSSYAHGRNFVLCPGKAYDRSPCGTGTSAKLACLVADGKLREGQVWRQESIVGSIFEGSVRIIEAKIFPRIRGSAYVNAEATLVIDPHDPF